MVEADRHLKLLPASIFDMNKMFDHIDMLSIGIWYQPYTVIPTLLGSDFGALGHLWSQNDVITSWLRLPATSDCFPHPYWTYTKCLCTLLCYPMAYDSSFMRLYPPYLAQIFWVLGHLWSQNDVIMSWLRLTATSNCFLHLYWVFVGY
jgi:hypothetical protein